MNDFISKVHELLVYPGTSRLYNTIKNYYFGINLKSQIEEFTKGCIKCQSSKDYVRENKFFYHLSKDNFNELIDTDLVGPYTLSEFKDGEGKVYILTIIDMHSRLVNLHILKNITSDNVAKAIESWLIKYGQPKALLSD
ncbi:hypothetical protein HERIO_217 [Hepatospora eriocheir]|uniref:Integrase catalytic domain-containing protein n=1 Tax=Hepatospora eriocheir TaxID=1081669 RepID=A0A1X0QDT5_9MICR|nr:hypothetical protein HERIO_217 [Hepatospora eriocheir]